MSELVLCFADTNHKKNYSFKMLLFLLHPTIYYHVIYAELKKFIIQPVECSKSKSACEQYEKKMENCRDQKQFHFFLVE